MAEPWIGESAVIEWMNAMSSTHSAKFGKSWLTCLPDWPYCRKVHFGPTTRLALRRPPRPNVETLIVLPSSS